MSLITHLSVNQNLLVYIINDAMTSGKKLIGYSEYSGVERKMGFLLGTTAYLRKGDNKRGESIILTGILPKIKVRWKLPKCRASPHSFQKGPSCVGVKTYQCYPHHGRTVFLSGHSLLILSS